MTRSIRKFPFTEALQAALDEVSAEEGQVRARLDELEVERRGLELALRRHLGENVTVTAVEKGSTTHWTIDGPDVAPDVAAAAAREVESAGLADVEHSGTMTDTVAQILQHADRPLSPKDIVIELAALGIPQENTTAVRGAISYLKRQERVYALGRGAWVMPGSPYDQHKRGDDMFSQVEDTAPTDAETPAADAAGVSVSDELAQEEGVKQGPVAAG